MTTHWKNVIEQLSRPFAKEDLCWRAGIVSKDRKRAQALAYADPRVYEDRLNEICPGEWSVRFTPWGESRLICELTIHGVTRSSTGEFDTEKRNAIAEGTVAEAQAFKRACSKFGLGRYLYDLPTFWVDFDEEKNRLKETPEIPNKYLPRITSEEPIKLQFTTPSLQAHQPQSLEPHTLSPERADAMSSELEKLGYPKREQLRLASSVLEKPIKDLTALSDSEAFEIWSYAKRLHRQAA
jgi:hypothetical protein